MKTFIQYQFEQEQKDYFAAVTMLESGPLNENILKNLSASIRQKYDFIKSLADISRQKLSDLIEIFKNTKVFNFFSKIKFSLDHLFGFAKRGFTAYKDLQKVISEYLASTKVVQWTRQELQKLDNWLKDKKYIRRFGGAIVGGILIYIWLNMSFTGDFSYDFDFRDIVSAITGSYSLVDLFASAAGIRMLILFATGAVFGISFPWPGPQSVQFVVGLIAGIKRVMKN